MRRAETAASSLSVQYSTRRFFAAFDPDTTPDSLAQLAATRDSYYLLAAAHRAAGRRIERRVRRALAWSDFKDRPFAETYWKAGDVARLIRRKASRLVRSLRRMVNV